MRGKNFYFKLLVALVGFLSHAHALLVRSVFKNERIRALTEIASILDQEVLTSPDQQLVPINIRPSKRDKDLRKDPRRVKIVDATLKQGDLERTCQMEPEEKVRVANQLAKLGVDILAVGEPAISPLVFSSIQEISKSVGAQQDSPVIMALCLAEKESVRTAYQAIQESKYPRLHITACADDLYMCVDDECTSEQVDFFQRVFDAVEYAKQLCGDVQFSTQDAFRIATKNGGSDFLMQLYSIAVQAGASTINLEDSFGYCTPHEIRQLLLKLRDKDHGVEGIENVTISLGCQDDLGLAVANNIAGIQAGVRQLHCTINGIGERAGAASLEEIVMILKTRDSYFKQYFDVQPDDKTLSLTSIRSVEIYKTSKMVSDLTGVGVQRNKAIVGENAFLHESGLHQDGITKNRETYEIMSSSEVGVVRENLVVGKNSNKQAFKNHLNNLTGFDPNLLTEDQVTKAFRKFKDIFEVKKTVSDMEIEAIVNDELYNVKLPPFELRMLQVFLGTTGVPTATAFVYDRQRDREVQCTATSNSGLQAACKALEEITNLRDVGLMDYSLVAKSTGVDAFGEAIIHLKCFQTRKIFYGRASHQDSIVATARSYLNALNRIYSYRKMMTQSLIDLQVAGTRTRSFKTKK